MRVWEQNNYLPSPIPWFQSGVDFRCCNLILSSDWNLVVRAPPPPPPPPCENRASLVAANISIDMPFTNMVDCISSMLRAGVKPYILPKNYSASVNGAVNKNRTLAKPSCQVRRLSKLKSACLTYLYSFVCSMARHVSSFVEAWLCYTHGCTFLALFPLPSPKPIGILNRRMQSPGK